MNRHDYWRAYMAGITLPTAFLLPALTVFCVARLVCLIPVPIERVMVFPMALIPNVFGAWNVLYVAVRKRRQWNIGIHGALLPFLLVPTGYVIARGLGFIDSTANGLVYFHAVHVPFRLMAIFFPVGVAVYYLAWKYIVAFFNGVLEIAK
jgi:hypothetical protein